MKLGTLRSFSTAGLLRVCAQISHLPPFFIKCGVKIFANKWRNSSINKEKPPQTLLSAQYMQLSALNHAGWFEAYAQAQQIQWNSIKWRGKCQKMILSKDPIVKKSSPSAKKKSHRVCACPSWIHNKFQRVNECVSGLPGKASTSWKRMVKKPPTWHGNSLQADWHPRNSPNALHLHFTYSLGLGQGLTDNAKTPAFSSFISERLMGSSKCHLNANRPL